MMTNPTARSIPISEIFGPTIQGEGALIGRPTVFVRTGGCDFRCNWCDTLYAVLPEYKNEWTPLSPEQIVARVLELSRGAGILVTLSGGNPALHDFSELLELGRSKNLSFALETQGSVARDWFSQLEYLILSPKPPSSGMTTDWTKVEKCLERPGAKTRNFLKIVIFDEADYAFAREASTRFPELPLYLQPGTEAPPDAEKLRARVEWLLEKCARDRWLDVTILPQLHVLLWGAKRGV
jgi:7-carboxy-7-deazaguanine synthase